MKHDHHGTQGRWMSPDPYGGSYDIFNPQSMNRYSYASNNPLVYVDPDGTSCDDGSGSCSSCERCYAGFQYDN